jgi:hypothetical protein
MTKDEQESALEMLDKIAPAIPVEPKTIIARAMAHALRELIQNSHGAASHAGNGKARRVRAPRQRPGTGADMASAPAGVGA